MSAPKLPVRLTSRARDDYRQIMLQTLLAWGERQQIAYNFALLQALEIIGDNPNIGRAREDLAPGYRSYLVEQHVILYRVTARSVSVSRIIHSRRDAHRALRLKQ